MNVRLAVVSVLLSLICSVGLAERVSEDWERLDGCTLLDNASNDGDSFHAKHGGTEFIFRLYFVDCPESETDARVVKRIKEQGDVFGLSPEEVLVAGKQAKKFTLDFLSKKPFTVYTHRADALGDSKLPRYYAVVFSGDLNLAEELARSGWARVYPYNGHKLPTHANFPSDAKYVRFIKDLEEFQEKAGRKHLGAFAIHGAADPQLKQEPIATKMEPPVVKEPEPKKNSGLININTATRAELDSLPGIGDALAGRVIDERKKAPFASKKDIMRVKGIKETIYAEIEPLIEAR